MSARERAVSPTETDGVRLTEAAANRIKKIIKEQNFPDTCYLFVGVAGKGCSGLAWILDIRDEQTAAIPETDEVFMSQDILIGCDFKSYMVGNLSGTEIDYTESLMDGGFVFNNPNATHVCGCKKSFSV